MFIMDKFMQSVAYLPYGICDPFISEVLYSKMHYFIT